MKQRYKRKRPIQRFVFIISTLLHLTLVPQSKITKHLKKEAKGIDYLVLWLDCDREGENICYEVIDCTLKWMRPHPGKILFL